MSENKDRKENKHGSVVLYQEMKNDIDTINVMSVVIINHS